MDLRGFPVFTGSNLESWIEWLEKYFVFHHFTDDNKLNLSQALMEGDAYEWLHRCESFQCWNEMKRELWFRFESPPRMVLGQQIKNIKQELVQQIQECMETVRMQIDRMSDNVVGTSQGLTKMTEMPIVEEPRLMSISTLPQDTTYDSTSIGENISVAHHMLDKMSLPTNKQQEGFETYSIISNIVHAHEGKREELEEVVATESSIQIWSQKKDVSKIREDCVGFSGFRKIDGYENAQKVFEKMTKRRKKKKRHKVIFHKRNRMTQMHVIDKKIKNYCLQLAQMARFESYFPTICEDKLFQGEHVGEKKWIKDKTILQTCQVFVKMTKRTNRKQKHKEFQSEHSFVDTSANIQFSKLVRTSSGLKDVVQDNVDASSLEVDTSEVLTSVLCVLITPERKLAGWLAVMKNVLHFSGEFLVEGTGRSALFKNFSVSKGSGVTKANTQNLVKWSSPYDSETFLDLESANNNKNYLKKVKCHRRWKIGKVKGVHWTRYLLQYTALEIFFQEPVPLVFLNFASQKNAKEVRMLIVSTRNEFLFPNTVARDKTAIISFVDRCVAMEMAETARDRWRKRKITNFEYLMILNTLAGRSYNDLTQYPVFPWVVVDYSSETLDFSKASTFRDLSKPVGAVDTRSLQGGKFDHADRLFHSVEGSVRNYLSNISDVKELIPEFLYMPEILVNSNSYYLGVKQDGEPLGDVCLPPWAKGSPEMFIARNREALESEYVSSHLHDWIDLIFGHKQRDKPTVETANIFYLTYEGAVDLDNMEDELQISAIEDQIANFGQTPIQIFRKKHPRRGPPC